MCAIFLIAIEARHRVIALHPTSARAQIGGTNKKVLRTKIPAVFVCIWPTCSPFQSLMCKGQGLGPDLQRRNRCQSRQKVASQTGVRIRVRARCSVPLQRFHGHGAATRTTRVQSQGGSTRDGASKPMLNPNTQCIINAASWPRHTRWRVATS
jgi:hypothetical protein